MPQVLGVVDPSHTFLLVPGVVQQMVERHPFESAQVRAAFAFILSLYGEILEYPENSPDASIFVHFKEVSDVSIRISPRSLDNLARHLRSLTDESSQSDPEQFVSLLSKVAFIAGQAGLRVDRPSTNQRMLNQIVQAIRTDFALACVKVLAHSSGYLMTISPAQVDQIFWALLEQDRVRLTQVFRQSLHMLPEVDGEENAARSLGRHAFTAASSQRIQRILLDSRERLLKLDDTAFGQSPLTRERAIELMDHPVTMPQASMVEMRILRGLLGPVFEVVIDVVLGRAGPDFTPPVSLADRKLTAESYSNLRSVADMEKWSEPEVLTLIDEYMDPELSPHFVYHSSVVSGDDWRRLRKRLRRSGR